jgi:hypothetical protein
MIHIASSALRARQSFLAFCCLGKIIMAIYTLSPTSSDPSPMPHQNNITEQIGGHDHGIEPPLVMLRPNASE